MDIHDQIMRAVLRVIGSEGIGGVTNRRIAQEAGVSLGSITYHFETKEEMLRKSLALFVREETERLTDLAIDGQRLGVSQEQAMAMVERVAESITFGPEQIGAVELFVHAGRDPEMREYARFCFEAYENVAHTILKGLGIDDPDPLVGPVVALIAGLQLRRLATGTPGNTGIADSLLMLLDRFLPTDRSGASQT
jgi:AcrR family transcriptional regulator